MVVVGYCNNSHLPLGKTGESIVYFPYSCGMLLYVGRKRLSFQVKSRGGFRTGIRKERVDLDMCTRPH